MSFAFIFAFVYALFSCERWGESLDAATYKNISAPQFRKLPKHIPPATNPRHEWEDEIMQASRDSELTYLAKLPPLKSKKTDNLGSQWPDPSSDAFKEWSNAYDRLHHS